MKDIVNFVLFSRIPCSGGSQLPCHEDTQAVLWRDPWGEKLRPPGNSHVNEPSWKHPLSA